MNLALTLVLLAALPPGPTPSLTYGARHARAPELVAKGKPASVKKKPSVQTASAGASVQVSTDLPVVEVKEKGRRGTAFIVKPNESLQATIVGQGKLAVVVYQALVGDETAATANVVANLTLDDKPQKPVTYKGKKSKTVTLLGPESPSVSTPKSATLTIGSGTHTLTLSIPAASTVAVIELAHYPKGAKNALPVEIVKPGAPVVAAASAPAPQADEPPLPPTTPPPPATSPAAESSTPSTELAAAPVTAPAASPAEERVKSGAARDALLGAYSEVTIEDSENKSSGTYYRAAADKPFAFIVDGPGVVTIRLHPLVPADASMDAAKIDVGQLLQGMVAADTLPGGTGKLTITENDVLLQTVDVDLGTSDRYIAVGVQGVRVAPVKEYRLTLGPKLARFALQLPETASQGLAIRYSFEAQPKSAAMALTLDLGDEATGSTGALGPTTVVTEMAVREKVVEKVVQVGTVAKEHVGIAVVAGAVIPTWGGLPAASAGLDLQWVLPFADGRLALNAEAVVQRHQLTSRGVDANQTQIHSSSLVWVLPSVRVGPTVRVKLGESFRVATAIRMSYARVSGTSQSLGGQTTATDNAFGVGGMLSLEIRVGVGWWCLDGGYLFAPKVPLAGALKDFDVGGVEVGTRFRFVL